MKIPPDHAEHYHWGDGCDGWHLVRHEELSVIQERVPPGAEEQCHRHATARQFFYILQGAAVIAVEGKDHCLTAGEGLEVAPGTAHQFKNVSDHDVIFLVISVPNSHGDRVAV